MSVGSIPQVFESSHTDANQVASLVLVQGTLGTSDTAGTARTMAATGDPVTGAANQYLMTRLDGTNDAVSIFGGTLGSILGIGGTVVTSGGGTTPVQGSVQVTGGSIVVTAGTVLNTGTVVNIATGTQQTLGTVANLNNGSVNILTGTIQSSGTSTGVGVVSNLTNGSVNILTGTVTSVGTNVGMGTLSNVGSVNTVTTVSNITNGSVRITVGTIVSDTIVGGTLQNLVSGTINALAAGTITGGTLTNLVSGTINALAAGTITTGTVSVTTGTVVLNTGTITTIAAGTQNTLGTVGNLNNGSVNLLTGTVTSVTNLAGGTVRWDPTTVPTMIQQGTFGTAGGSFFGTLSAASGAGTKHYVQGVDVVMQSGTADVRILAGTAIQGTGVLAAGQFPAGGGIAKNWWPHFVTGTNSELTYHFVGAGTAFITVSYWKGA